jgi:long-chain acyl-CoA synthetase
MPSFNLFHLLREAADLRGNEPFFTSRGSTVGYREALDVSRRFASFLRRSGVQRGDRILMNIGNTPAFIYTLFAAFQVGATAVLTNPAARRFELHHDCEVSTPRMAITDLAGIGNFKIGDRWFIDPATILVTEKNSSRQNVADIVPGEEPLRDIEVVDGGHPAVIIFTSAMDGNPLGAMITHGGIGESARAACELFVDRTDVFLAPLPFYHSFGLLVGLFVPLNRSVPLHLVERFSPRQILSLLLGHRVTVFCGVPAIFDIMNKLIPGGTVFPGVKAWISGGEALSTRLQATMRERFGVDIRQGYGLTEASPIVTWNMLHLPNKPGSVGVPMPYNEVRTVSEHSPDRQGEGEILVKGSNVIPAYFRNPQKTAELIDQGWLRTGDIGRMDEDGYLYITGRKKNMIIRRGYNVYPREVEKIMSQHPGIGDVRVFGHSERLDDCTFSESLEARVSVKNGHDLTESSIQRWCVGNISAYKIPETILITR